MNEIKWIIASRKNGEGWIAQYFGSGENKPHLEKDDGTFHPIIENIPMGELSKYEFAIFRYRGNWWERRPLSYLDFRDHSNDPIGAGVGAIINRLPSDYF